jgi:hypothetical protein
MVRIFRTKHSLEVVLTWAGGAFRQIISLRIAVRGSKARIAILVSRLEED